MLSKSVTYAQCLVNSRHLINYTDSFYRSIFGNEHHSLPYHVLVKSTPGVLFSRTRENKTSERF